MKITNITTSEELIAAFGNPNFTEQHTDIAALTRLNETPPVYCKRVAQTESEQTGNVNEKSGEEPNE